MIGPPRSDASSSVVRVKDDIATQLRGSAAKNHQCHMMDVLVM